MVPPLALADSESHLQYPQRHHINLPRTPHRAAAAAASSMDDSSSGPVFALAATEMPIPTLVVDVELSALVVKISERQLKMLNSLLALSNAMPPIPPDLQASSGGNVASGAAVAVSPPRPPPLLLSDASLEVPRRLRLSQNSPM